MKKYKRVSKVLRKDQLSAIELNEKLEELDIQPILKSQVRQVKWLYNNSNKLTLVYEEKLVRIIVDKLEKRIKTLENLISNI